MTRVTAIAVAALVFAVQPLSAQLWDAGLPGDDLGSIALNFGVVSPTTTFSDDGSGFDQGTAIGAALSYWPTYHVGLRTHLLRGVTEGNHGEFASNCQSETNPGPCTSVGFQEPTVWLYGIEASVRRPMGDAGLAWFPYVSAGVVGKSYRWSIDRPRVGNSASGWTVAGGLELRTGATGPIGFIAEVRQYQTGFTFLGKNEDQSDLAFTAGITLNR